MPDANHSRDMRREESSEQDTLAAAGMAVQQDDDYLSIQKAARQAGVSRAFVLSWIRNGFIDAKTSQHGWMVRAGDIEAARRGAEDAREGYAAEEVRQDSANEHEDTLVSERQQHLLAIPASQHSKEAMLAPFAEFIRDQADVVQEQAETIGWLQAELRRMRELVQAQESVQHAEATQPAPATEARDTAEAPLEDVPLSPLDVIAADPFSEEAAQARIMIEETERKITDMWDEQIQRRSRHIDARSQRQHDDTWVRRIVSSWKRQGAV